MSTWVELICNDFAQLYYYIVTLLGLCKIDSKLKIKNYSQDTIACIVLGFCCLVLSMESLKEYLNEQYKAVFELAANLSALIYISGNFLAYLDQKTIDKGNLIKVSTHRMRYSPGKQKGKRKK